MGIDELNMISTMMWVVTIALASLASSHIFFWYTEKKANRRLAAKADSVKSIEQYAPPDGRFASFVILNHAPHHNSKAAIKFQPDGSVIKRNCTDGKRDITAHIGNWGPEDFSSTVFFRVETTHGNLSFGPSHGALSHKEQHWGLLGEKFNNSGVTICNMYVSDGIATKKFELLFGVERINTQQDTPRL